METDISTIRRLYLTLFDDQCIRTDLVEALRNDGKNTVADEPTIISGVKILQIESPFDQIEALCDKGRVERKRAEG